MYAYSDWFQVELDFIITVDPCEGILNPCSMCKIVRDYDLVRYYSGNLYRVQCLTSMNQPTAFIRKTVFPTVCYKITSFAVYDEQCSVLLRKTSTDGILGIQKYVNTSNNSKY